MDSEDTIDFTILFENCQSSAEKLPVEEIKPEYEPIHLPSSIIEILNIWTSSSIETLSFRVGTSPCDSSSLDTMFIHTWSESHFEQPYRLTRIIDDLYNYFWISHQLRWKGIPGRMANNDEIRLVHSEEFLSGLLSVERGDNVDNVVSMRTLSYANPKYNFKSVGPIAARACRTAAGTTINLISSVVRRDIDIGFAFIRPAGHHSSTDKVGAFCGLNSVSIDIIQFQPSLILISAGFDAAQGEAEQCAQLTPNEYFQVTKKLKELKFPLVFILEGGYQQQSLVQSIRATFEALFDI
ncbi:unnamed protein product [Rotaria magnacalcarata]|uniref:histone deacetylase n=1 Tax=Rotaria magnacalcarata TaxID=392030 RepID=A0A8S3E090_9BILA|nr:unnamed protein product [Rotaria magnacalcarata]CAF5176298.1 unnamed protein product [Rotaria magnacalcarata]CAF5179738.1 unnamed protein product [Rotaria magnacalcarata]